MADNPSTFRDFGILPENLQPPPGKVRSFLSTGRIIGQYIGTLIVVGLGVGLAVPFALFAPMPLGLLPIAASLATFGTYAYLATRHDYGWVELDGDKLRAKHLYTGRTIERSISEIESLTTMVIPAVTVETAVAASMLGRVRGIAIQFRDRRTPLRVMRADPAMTNAQELILAILYRMSQLRELDAEVIHLQGQPLVRRIFWKGEQPTAPRANTGKVVLGVVMGLVLLAGLLLTGISWQQEARRAVGIVPPQKITVASLIKNGPGANRHVTLTDFRPAGYVVETKSGSWQQVWVPLFPPEAPAGDIKVVLSCSSVRDLGGLQRLMQPGQITGICSASLRETWGTTLGPKLVEANPGCSLTAAWSVEEMSEPPSEALVTGFLYGGVASLGTVLLLALILVWRRD
jgi:hypothetical protein